MAKKKVPDNPPAFKLKNLDKLSEFGQFRALLLVVLAIVLFFRRPDAIMNAQPWAEDGNIFIQGVIDQSYRSLIATYAGYMHLIPRVDTFFAMMFGLVNAPLIMNLSSLIIAVFCVSYFFDKSFRFLIRNDFARFIVCIIIICVPVSEIWLNITNIQWVLSIYLTLWALNLVFNYDTVYKKIGLKDMIQTIFLAMAFLTCSFGVILLPLLAWFVYKKARDNELFKPVSILYILPAIASVAQTAISLLSPDKSPMSFDLTGTLTYFSSHVLSWYYYIGPNFILGKDIFFFTLLLLLVFAVLMVRSYEKKHLTADAFLLLLILLYVLLLSLNRSSFITLVSSGTLQREMGGRYAFYPMTLLLIMVARNIDFFGLIFSNTNKTGLKLANYACALLVLIFLINTVFAYSIAPLADTGYKKQASYYAPGGQYNYSILINPKGWSFTAPSDQMVITPPVYDFGQNTVEDHFIQPDMWLYIILLFFIVTLLCQAILDRRSNSSSAGGSHKNS